MQFFARQGAHKFYLEQQPLQCVCQPVTVQHLPEAGESSLPIELAPSLTLTVVSNCRLDTRCDSACWDCLRAASVRDRGMMDQGCPNEAVSVLSYSLHGWLRSHRVESRRGWVEFSRDFKAVRSVVLTPLSIFPAFSCALNTKRQKRGFPVWIGQDWQRRVTLAALYKAALARRALNTGIGLAFFSALCLGSVDRPDARFSKPTRNWESDVSAWRTETVAGDMKGRSEPCKHLQKARSAEDRKPAGRRKASGMDGRCQLSGGSLQPRTGGATSCFVQASLRPPMPWLRRSIHPRTSAIHSDL